MRRFVITGKWLLLMICLLASIHYIRAYRTFPDVETGNLRIDKESLTPSRTALLEPEDWAIFQDDPDRDEAGYADLTNRYQLVGTYIAYSSGGESADEKTRLAILNDLEEQKQFIVGERDRFNDISVSSVAEQYATFRSYGRTATLVA